MRPRTPTVDGTRVYTRVHIADWRGARKPASRLGAMNFAFTEEQEELRSTVRAFLESKSPESRGPPR